MGARMTEQEKFWTDAPVKTDGLYARASKEMHSKFWSIEPEPRFMVRGSAYQGALEGFEILRSIHPFPSKPLPTPENTIRVNRDD